MFATELLLLRGVPSGKSAGAAAVLLAGLRLQRTWSAVQKAKPNALGDKCTRALNWLGFCFFGVGNRKDIQTKKRTSNLSHTHNLIEAANKLSQSNFLDIINHGRRWSRRERHMCPVISPNKASLRVMKVKRKSREKKSGRSRGRELVSGSLGCSHIYSANDNGSAAWIRRLADRAATWCWRSC